MPYLGTKGLKASDIRRFNVTGSTSATHTLTWVAKCYPYINVGCSY